MRARFTAISLSLGAILSVGMSVFAQDKAPGKVDQTGKAAILESADAEFRELVCSRAIDRADANQDRAIEIAIQRKYVDKSFNAFVYDELKNAFEGDESKQVVQAIQLLPLSSLDDDVKAKLVFECYLGTEAEYQRLKEARRSVRPVTEMRKQLLDLVAKSPKATKKLIKERLESSDTPAQMFPLIHVIKQPTDDLLPLVLNAAKSDDAPIAKAAMDCAATLIQRIETELNTVEKAEPAKPQSGDSKYQMYARRIVSRYDLNKDDALDQQEYGKMLMSPLAADKNGDKRITLKEYADYLESRSKK